MRSKSNARKVVKCIIILLSLSSVKWPWWRWKKPFDYSMTATLLVLSLTDFCTFLNRIFFVIFSSFCFPILFPLEIIRVRVKIKIGFILMTVFSSVSLFSYNSIYGDIPSLKIKVISLADHSVWAFKDLLMTMIGLFAKELLDCYFSNCFWISKRKDLPSSLSAVRITFVLTSA